MKNLLGTKTEQNLRDAFAGESQARNIPIMLQKQRRMAMFK